MAVAPVELFNEILIWPLELEYTNQTAGKTWIAAAKDWIKSQPASPWSDLDSYDRGTTSDPGVRYAEFVYFHPFIQRVLYPSPTDPNPAISILKRDDVKKIVVGLQGVDGILTLNVKRVHLYLFRTQIAILVVEVSGLSAMELDTALQFMDQFRAAYAPYFDDKGTAGHCPVSVDWLTGEGTPVEGAAKANYHDSAAMYKSAELPGQRRPPVSAHWAWLLHPLDCGEGNFRWRQLEDHRIPTMTFIAVADPFALTPGDLTRICFCDEKGNREDYPYAPGFLSNFEKKYCYDRFWNPPPEPGADQSQGCYIEAKKTKGATPAISAADIISLP